MRRASREISLCRELEFLKHYVRIQQRRLANARSDFQIDADVLSAWVPSLMLQPLVENAIRYGIGKHKESDLVTLRAFQSQDRLCLEISNLTGVLEDSPDRLPARGIGLLNTRARLEQLYGQDHILRLANLQPRGVATLLSIPLRRPRSNAAGGPQGVLNGLGQRRAAIRHVQLSPVQSGIITNGPQSIRTLIIDDEPPARRSICRFLKSHPEFEVVAECGDGESAVAAIVGMRPGLVFLDVQLPELDGVEVVRQVGPERMPATIFVTAYDRHALQAFDAEAVDYLLGFPSAGNEAIRASRPGPFQDCRKAESRCG